MYARAVFQFCDNIENLAKFLKHYKKFVANFTLDKKKIQNIPEILEEIRKFYCKNNFGTCQQIFLWGWTQVQNLVL
jgi:hypothetical protein